MTVRNALVGAVAAATAFALAACGGTTTPTAADGKIEVVASTNVWAGVVEAVGGDEVSVTSIIDDPSGDPHSYESKPSDVTAVRDAKLVIFNGGGYDDFFPGLLDSGTGSGAGSPRKIEAFALAGREGTAGEGHEVNEHVWYDLGTVHEVADRVAADLAAIAPDKKASFEAAAADFTGKVDALRARLAGKGAGKRVLETEPVAHYLLEVSGAQDATPGAFSEAVEAETDVPAGALGEVLGLVGGKGVAVLVNNAQTSNAATDQVVGRARDAGVPVVEVTETLPGGATGYLDWMTKQVDSLVAALGS